MTVLALIIMWGGTAALMCLAWYVYQNCKTPEEFELGAKQILGLFIVIFALVSLFDFCNDTMHWFYFGLLGSLAVGTTTVVRRIFWPQPAV